jgi:hypothetical protein
MDLAVVSADVCDAYPEVGEDICFSCRLGLTMRAEFTPLPD